MVKNVLQINVGLMVNADVCVKNVIYVKNIKIGILLYVIAKKENILQLL